MRRHWDIDVDPETGTCGWLGERFKSSSFRHFAVTFPRTRIRSIVAHPLSSAAKSLIPKHIIVPEVPDSDEKKIRRRQLFYLAPISLLQ